MDQWLGVSRAARLAGVTRARIQRQIAAGRLPTFEGKVQLSDLLKLYPDVQVQDSSMLETVSQIKDDAVFKAARLRDQSQDVESLLAEVKRLRKEAAFCKEQAARYKQVIMDLKGMLIDVRERLETKQRPFLDAVIQWLANKTKHNG